MPRKLSLFSITLIVLFSASVPLSSQAPLKTTVCELLQNPPAFDHRLVELQAFVSWGFEDFTLFDPVCNLYPQIWLEYGGKVNSGTIYFGSRSNLRRRSEDLSVQGISIPLLEDDFFNRLHKRIHAKGPRGHGPLTRATLVGSYFAGKRETYSSGASAWSGFGHFGCCTLLVIQRIKDVSDGDSDGLDPYAIPAPLIPGSALNSDLRHSLIPEDASKFILESQRKAEEGSRSWAFDDPVRVAVDLIESSLGGKAIDKSQLKTVSMREGFFEYEAKMPTLGTSFSVAISRPAWLTFYARDPKRVAWVVLSATAERLDRKKPMTLPK